MKYQPAPLPAEPSCAPVSLYELEIARDEDSRAAWELVALSLCGIAQALAILLW